MLELLWNAVIRSDVDLLRELLSRRGEASLPLDKNGRSLLYCAASYGHVKMAQFLLEMGATHNPRDNGLTPLNVAAGNSRSEMVDFLLKNGTTHDLDQYGWTPFTLPVVGATRQLRRRS